MSGLTRDGKAEPVSPNPPQSRRSNETMEGHTRKYEAGGWRTFLTIIQGTLNAPNTNDYLYIRSVQLEETKKVESQCVRDEGGRLLHDKGHFRGRWVRFFRSLLNSKSDMLDRDIPKRLPRQPVASALGINATEEEIATAMKAMANAKAVGSDGLPAELLKLGLQQDRTIPGATPTHHPHLARGGSPTAVEIHGHYHSPQEGRQDGMRKLPRHLARVTRR